MSGLQPKVSSAQTGPSRRPDMTDGRCRFGPRAKRETVARLVAGEKARAFARSMGCSPTTVTSARDRWLAATERERASGAWCAPRRPVPGCCRWQLSADEEQRILAAPERTNWGEMRLQAVLWPPPLDERARLAPSRRLE